MVKLPIYMDNHATTRTDSRVIDAMMPFFCEKFGNAASRNHSFGWEAEEGVDKARNQIAALINAKPKEIIFTSGATESDNLAIKGVVEFNKDKGSHVITCVTEHKAILDSCRALERQGKAIVTYLPVDKYGMVDPDDVRKAITDKTVLITIMFANNEIGTIHPIAEIGRIAKEKGIIFHCDATQGVGKVPVDVENMRNRSDVDERAQDLRSQGSRRALRALQRPARAAHACDGRRRARARDALRDAQRHRDRRARRGLRDCRRRRCPRRHRRLIELRDKLHAGIFERLDEVYLNGHPTERLPGNLNVSFAYVEGESLLMGIHDIAVSSGSACTSATLEPSYVIRALGVDEELAHSSIRFGLGRFNTEEEVDFVTERVSKEVKRLREMSPLYEMAKEGIDLKSVQWKGE